MKEGRVKIDSRLYNTRGVSIVVLLALIVAVSSCKSHSNAQPVNDAVTAKAEVAQADKLYAQRDDLMQLRQACSTVTSNFITCAAINMGECVCVAVSKCATVSRAARARHF